MSTKTKKSFIHHRRDGRVIAFKVLFTYGFNIKPLEELLDFEWLEKKYSEESLEYAKYLIKGTVENIETIDEKIRSKLRNWDFERISNIDKAILRFSIFSMLLEKDIPEKVVINEAIEIVKDYGSEESYKFVNGILDAIKRSEKQS